MDRLTKTALAMCRYMAGDVKRIEHFMKVHAYAEIIGRAENLDERTQEILEAAAYVHDIGIRNSEIKYGSSSGYYQQIEGPVEAERLLADVGYCKDFTDRVKYLVSRHHKYTDIDGADCQILIEADFIVNIREDNISSESAADIYNSIFVTETGRKLFKELYGAEQEEVGI